MPAHVLAKIFGLDRQIAIHSAANNAVIADGVVAIQPYARKVDHQRVAGRSRFDIKGAGLRIAAEDPGHAFLVGPAGVNRGGVDGVARPDSKHRLVERRKLAIEDRRLELMVLRRPVRRAGTSLAVNWRVTGFDGLL